MAKLRVIMRNAGGELDSLIVEEARAKAVAIGMIEDIAYLAPGDSICIAEVEEYSPLKSKR